MPAFSLSAWCFRVHGIQQMSNFAEKELCDGHGTNVPRDPLASRNPQPKQAKHPYYIKKKGRKGSPRPKGRTKALSLPLQSSDPVESYKKEGGKERISSIVARREDAPSEANNPTVIYLTSLTRNCAVSLPCQRLMPGLQRMSTSPVNSERRAAMPKAMHGRLYPPCRAVKRR